MPVEPAKETPAEAADRIARSLGANPHVIARELKGLAARLDEESRRLRLWADGLAPSTEGAGDAG